MNRSRRIENLSEFLGRFDRAETHFREARRQTLLGAREVMIVLEDLAQAYASEAPALKSVAGGLLVGRGLLDWLIGRMPDHGDRAQQIEYQIEALAILRDLVTAELTRGAVDDSAERREGLLTVVSVIDQEIERLETERMQLRTQPTDAPAESGVQWIEVEQ